MVDALLARDVDVRALVRDPTSASAEGLRDRGIEVVAGLLDDLDSLTAAMRGVSGAFAVTTPFEAGPEAEIEQGRAILAAAQAAQVPLATIDNPDMHAMWSFLRGEGYTVDLSALHADFPDVGWTSFAQWAAQTLVSS